MLTLFLTYTQDTPESLPLADNAITLLALRHTSTFLLDRRVSQIQLIALAKLISVRAERVYVRRGSSGKESRRCCSGREWSSKVGCIGVLYGKSSLLNQLIQKKTGHRRLRLHIQLMLEPLILKSQYDSSYVPYPNLVLSGKKKAITHNESLS